MEEQEQLRIGSYCHELLEDPRFNELVSVVELSLSQEILTSEDAGDREGIYYTYQGLKSFLDICKQFVQVKDQILLKQEQESELN